MTAGCHPSIYPAQAGYFVSGAVAIREIAICDMHEVIEAAREVLDAHRVSRCRVCIGLSGGLDSVVLLHVAKKLASSHALALSAIHVDHGLHESAPRWAQFCRELCERLDVPLTVEKVSVSRDSGVGIEAAARAQRYAVFARVQADFLALAHHQDDQVETFLLQLLRGAGAKGLSAMPVERALPDSGPRLLRPFLAVTRSQLAEFAKAHELEWIEDASNAEVQFDRNYLRHAVLPVIEQRFPAYRSTLARAGRNLADAAELADILGQQDLERVRIDDGLMLEKMISWPRARALNVLRCLLRTLGYAAPRRSLLAEAVRQAFEARADARVRVDFAEFSLRRHRGALLVVKHLRVPRGWQAVWRGEAEVGLPAGLGRLQFRRARGEGASAGALRGQRVRIAFRNGGERMALAENRPHRELKKLFQEAGVAPWLRERTPLVFCGQELLFVPGLGVAAEFQAKPGDETWHIEWVRD